MKTRKSNKNDPDEASTSKHDRGRRKAELEKFRDEIEIKRNDTASITANKKLQANDSNMFLCRTFEERWEATFQRRGVFSGRVPKCEKAKIDVETGAELEMEMGKKKDTMGKKLKDRMRRKRLDLEIG
ncbi:hypothetical protein M9H77_16166 [Catharanthus roseus]|uniref:Uncharacterized protein n=1 Tax=Catharanthus roseus TaxID=4058 RepID=A0ACC0AZ73_CATRO|nr:hypothetical protein M9H77_16166 [Catharanthus roseus]